MSLIAKCDSVARMEGTLYHSYCERLRTTQSEADESRGREFLSKVVREFQKSNTLKFTDFFDIILIKKSSL